VTRFWRIPAVLALAVVAAPGVILVFLGLSIAACAGALKQAWRRFSSFPNPD
jgi:hypothetical protein